MAVFPQEGYRDLCRRLRIAWLRIVRFRVRRDLFQAEAELGWLAWEQVDFFDEQSLAAIRKIRDFEEKQAALQNSSAELSRRKAALDEELAREKAAHDAAHAAMAAERSPFAADLQQAERARRAKMEAIERFDRAIAEIGGLEKALEGESMAFMKIQNPSLEVRTEARKISDEMVRLASERARVLLDKENAAREAAGLESRIAELRGELQRIDTAASAARDTLAAATRRIGGERRQLDREKKKSAHHMSHLDRKKRQPYRFIGSCLADHGIAPLNQPAVIEKVIALRDRSFQLSETMAKLRVACVLADAGSVGAFYFLLAACGAALIGIIYHCVH